MHAASPFPPLLQSTPGLHQLGSGAWGWIQPHGAWGESNAGLLVGDDASLLVDTLWDQRLTRRMLAAMAPQLAQAPIVLAVNTHADGDHWWGNAELPAKCEIVASAPVVEAMREEAPPQRLATLGRLSRLSGMLPGRAGQLGRYVGAMLTPFAFEEVELRFPNRTYRGRTDEVVGGRAVTLFDMGPAHTAADTIVHVPDAGLVFAADLLFVGVTPVMWHGPVASWIAALERLLALDADVFLPGHGPVAGRAEVQALHDYWSWLAVSVAAHQDAGRTPLQTCRLLVHEPQFAAYRDWVAPERMYISVAAIQRRHAGGGPLPTAPLARTRIMDAMAQLQRELARRRR